MKFFKNLLFALFAALLFIPFGAYAADEYGNFERILEASPGSFDATTAALEKALAESKLKLEGKSDLNYEDPAQKVRVYIVTSPAFNEAVKDEPSNTVSANVMRIGVYEYGPGKPVHINMLNPVADAMVFYAKSKNYANIITAAKAYAQEIRDVAAKVPGKAVSVQLEPVRSEKSYNKYNGDGPAKMMAMFRNWKESQNVIFEAPAADFEKVVTAVRNTITATSDKSHSFDDASGWRIINETKIGNAVQFGVINDYASNKCIRINSDFRSDGKSKDAPYPGVDHAPGLPLEVIVYVDGDKTKVVQYGLMWFFQKGWWDSGYMAFAKNTLIPSILFSSLDTAVSKANPKVASK